MTCRMCRDHYKGLRPASFASDPECAFPDGGPFTVDNWMCETALAVCALVGRSHEEQPEGIARYYAEDQTCAMIDVYEIELPGEPPDEAGRYSLWVTWYKRRGRTGNMILLGDEANPVPRPPNEADALAILDAYARQAAWRAKQPKEATP